MEKQTTKIINLADRQPKVKLSTIRISGYNDVSLILMSHISGRGDYVQASARLRAKLLTHDAILKNVELVRDEVGDSIFAQVYDGQISYIPKES